MLWHTQTPLELFARGVTELASELGSAVQALTTAFGERNDDRLTAPAEK